MDVLRKAYDVTCSLWEYVELHLQEFSASEALESFMNSSMVTCNAETNMRLNAAFTTNKASTMDELLDFVITCAAAKGQMRDNVLSLGYRRSQIRPAVMGSQTSGYENNMVSHVQSPVFEELHELIGSDLMVHLLKDLNLFVKTGSCYLQVAGCPANEVGFKQDKATKTDGKSDETRPFVDGNALVSRQIYHAVGSDKKRCFPKTHVMETTASSPSGAISLMTLIFQDKDSKRLAKCLRNSVDSFVVFLRRHKSCPFKVLLDKYCAFDGIYEETGTLKSVPYYQVKLLCLAICKRAIPLKLWGSLANRTAFLSNMERYLSLRKKDRMSVKNVMAGIRISDCDFVKSPKRAFGCRASQSESSKKQGLVTKFFVWLMNSYIAPLLRNAFTITESVPGGNRVFFYRKEVWAKAQEDAVEEMHSLTPLLEEDASRVESIGLAPMRLIPKTCGLRPIANLGAKINPSDSFPYLPRSVNQLLSNIQSVLTYESQRSPELLGAAVTDYGEIFYKLSTFKDIHKRDGRCLYVVRLDFSKCYERINHDKMLEILEQVVKEDEYTIRKYCTIKTIFNDNLVFEHPQPAAPAEDNRYFPTFVEDVTREKKLNNALTVDKMNYASVCRDELMRDLVKHIKGNIVQLSSQKYLQKCGIAQGSKISPILCNLYLGHIEREFFPDILSSKDSLLMRWMDDPLLLTYDLELAKRYLTGTLELDPAYNCEVNVAKCLINFETLISAGMKMKKLQEGDIWIPWCGILINKVTLEVKYDYSKTQDMKDLKNRLSFDITKTPGKKMVENLMAAMQAKLHQLFLHPMVNSVRTVEINLQESFVYFARRLDAFVSELPTRMQVCQNPDFFLKAMENIIQRYYTLARRFLDRTITQERVFSLFYNAVFELIRRKSARSKLDNIYSITSLEYLQKVTGSTSSSIASCAISGFPL